MCVCACVRACERVFKISSFPQLKVEVPPQVLWSVPLLVEGGELDRPEEQVGHVHKTTHLLCRICVIYMNPTGLAASVAHLVK